MAQRTPTKPTLQVAASARSSCYICKDKIEKDRLRVGMPARHAGLSVVKWTHPQCFAKLIRLDKAPTNKAKCTQLGTPIQKNELRVLMELLTACGDVKSRKIFSIAGAHHFVNRLRNEAQVQISIDKMRGFDDLDEQERERVVTVLNGPPIEPPLGGEEEARPPTKKRKFPAVDAPSASDTDDLSDAAIVD